MTQAIQILKSNPASSSTFDWGQLTWFANSEQKNSADMTVGRCVLNPGMSNPRHLHPNCSEVLVVVQGRILHTGPGDTQVEMTVSDTVTIPPGVWHCARNIGDEPAVLFIAFSSADRQTVGEK